MTRSKPFAILTALIFLLANPLPVFAQGFEFGEEDVEPVDEEDVEEAPEEDDGMTFDSEDVEDSRQYSDSGTPSVAIVAVPGPHMDDDRRQKVQEEMNRVANTVTDVIIVGPETVRPGLEMRGEDCVREPLCLASVGEEAKVDRIVIARVNEREDGFELLTDYFDVDDKLFIKYHSETGLGGTGAIVDAVEPSLKDVFGITDYEEVPGTHEDDSGTVQRVLAYGTAAIAVAAFGGGVVFGLKARSQMKELRDSPQDADGVYQELTQVEADQMFRDARTSATTANIFYGLAIGLGLTSALLFYIQAGSDVASDEELRSHNVKDIQLAPIVSADGLGVGAGFRF